MAHFKIGSQYVAGRPREPTKALNPRQKVPRHSINVDCLN